MPKALSRREVEAIAELAHLTLTDAEAELFARQLSDILAFADAIREVDTTGVPPTAHVLSGEKPLRPDEVRPSLPRELRWKGLRSSRPRR